LVNYAEALAYLDDHATYEKTGRVTDPTLEKMERLMGFMGDPQLSFPVIHITGTNGKGSTAQMITRLLMAQGLTVGTTTSPHLERVNERIRRNGEAISDDEFAEQIAAIADIEGLAGVRPGYFEITTAAAFRWFADVAVDVAVVEVGMLGAWDATNVVNADVAVVTNVGMDHAQFAGPTTLHIAQEKSGIVKPNSRLVLGEADPDLAAVFRARPNAGVIERDVDFECVGNTLALGGRLVDLRTPTSIYTEVFVPLHGRHQGDNAALALAAVESFFDAPLSYEVVTEGFAAVEWPGRFEVLGHQPLVIVDGAHNPHGADACANVYSEDFDPAGKRIMVVGFLTSQDPSAMLSALHADEADVVIVCTPPSPRGVPAQTTADAARKLGCENVIVAESVSRACERALANADADDAILVTGSLYVVGEARPHLKRILARR
jgi:dihydrofolate synthase / folylpolyglutamate synthase